MSSDKSRFSTFCPSYQNQDKTIFSKENPQIKLEHCSSNNKNPCDQPTTHLDFNNSMNPLPQNPEDHHQLEDVAIIPDFHPLQHFTPYERNRFSRTSYLHAYVNDRGEGFSGGSSSSVMTSENFQVDDIISHISNWVQVAVTCGEGNDVFLAPANEMAINNSWKPSIRWFKLRVALKWGISVRKDVAARRRATPLQNMVLGNALKI